MGRIHIIVDFDDCLAPTGEHWKELSYLAHQSLGHKDVTKEMISQFKTSPDIRRYLMGLSPKNEFSKEMRKYDTIEKRIESFENRRISIFDDTKKALKWLRNNGCRLYLLSNGPKETGLYTINRMGIQDDFDQIRFNAEKPGTDAALELLTDCRPNDELWVAGDSLYLDGGLAQKLGARFILVDDTPNSRINAAYKIKRNSFECLL